MGMPARPRSGLTRFLIERDLHAIRVLESYGLIAPRIDDRSVYEGRSPCQQPLHCGIEIGHLQREPDLSANSVVHARARCDRNSPIGQKPL